MIYPANFEQKIGFDRLREQVAARCTMRAARARLAGETFSTSAREIARRLTLADEMRLLLDMEHEFPGGEYPDVDHIVAKLRVEGSFLDVEEVVTLHRALTVVGGIVAFILNREEQYPALHARSRGVAAFPEIVQRIDAIVDRFGNVKDNASPGLLEIRCAVREREGQAAKRLQAVLSAAKNAGIPIVFFNREVENSVVDSYENCAFVGTDAAEAGHMQGEMIGNYLLENYDAVDLNGDGTISYVLFKGQEGNKEAEYRTQYSVEDADAILTEAGKPALSFYDANNTSKYLVDTTGNWSSQAATDYMNTVLAAYSEASGNMVELVIANNDGMAEGAIAALQAAGYNTGEEGSTTIPVYGVDAMDSAVQKIENGQMTGTVKQDAEGMASTIMTLVNNINTGAALMDNTSDFVVDSDCAKIRVPYAMVTSEEAAA